MSMMAKILPPTLKQRVFSSNGVSSEVPGFERQYSLKKVMVMGSRELNG
jgi:hypothetical protein